MNSTLDHEELARFFTERRADLVRFASLQLRDPALAEDVVQETFLAAERNAAGFDGRSSLKTWIFVILKNKVLDAMRRRQREVPASQIDGQADGAESAETLFNQRGFWATEHRPHRWADPDDSLEEQEFWRVFELCIDGLPTRPAQVFSMRELLGLATKDICRELSISTSNCWVLLHRARLSLRACLEASWFT